MTIKKKISGASESNAGDDFHILWAARKALDLLNFADEGLKLISIEGPAPVESIEIDKTGEKLLAIDMAEYYGGNTFETARQVIFSQLKYSERQIQKTYTLARLCEGKRGGTKGSIIEKLAKAFKEYYIKYGKKKLIEKLIIKLVSTRKISTSLQKDIEKVQSYLVGNHRITKNQLLAAHPLLKPTLEKVLAASKLPFDECITFLNLLDFSDCGTDVRRIQKHHLIKAISELNNYEIKNQFNSLNQMIREKMLPEAIERNSNNIVKEDIISELKQGSIYSIFPVPPRINYPNNLIERDQLKKIANEIISSKEGAICLHGEAGIGKTTIITSLSKYLPDNSVTIIYDCYGQGTYLDDSVIRHTHQNAITQICNELAQKTGSPLLLSSRLSEYEYISEFRKRLENAISILAKSYPKALLTIIIDAADNSLTAAKIKQDKCFVRSLTSMESIPRGCKIVFTTRTQRIDSLELSDYTPRIPIKRFTLKETAQFIKHKFPIITKEQIAEFHNLTNQNPRVQYYALDNKNTIKEVFTFLKPHGKTVGNIIRGQIKEAKKKLGDKNKVDTILNAIIHLPRPVPIKYVASLSESNELDISDFCLDLSTGILLSNQHISFRDEDFESHLREQYPAKNEQLKKLTELFLAEIDKDVYINIHLANVLYSGGKYDELRDIVLGSKNLDIISDPLKQKEVSVTRVRLALKSCSNKEDNAIFLKLVFLCAEASKTDKYRLNLIKENIDLASQYLDSNTTEKLFFEITSNVHHGSAHMEFAALLSRNSSTQLFAEKHLSLLRSWVEMRNRVPESDLKNYHISKHDIACQIEATLRLYGPARARDRLLSWSPKEIHFKVVTILVRQLIKYSTEKDIKEWLKQTQRADILLVVIENLRKSNTKIEIDIERLAKVCIILLKKNLVDFQSGIDTYLVSFCEYLFEKGHKESLPELLSLISLPVPEHSVRFYSGISAGYGKDDVSILHNSFRLAALKAVLNKQQLVAADFYPKRFRDEEQNTLQNNQKQRNKSDKEEFDKLYSKLLPVYHVRAAIITKTLSGSLTKNISDVIKQLDSDYTLSYQRTDAGDLYKFICTILCDLSPRTKKKSEFINLLRNLCVKRHNELGILFILADAATNAESTHELAIKLLSDAENLIISHQENAENEINNYLKCARIANKISLGEGNLYFQKAIESASQVDIEAFNQIKALAELTEISSKGNVPNPRLAYEFSRFSENASIRLEGYDHFPWEKSISAIENLDYPTAMATWCKWDHKNYEKGVFAYWSIRLKSALQKGIITPKQAASLTILNIFDYQWGEFIEILLQKLKTDEKSLKIFLSNLLRDLQTVCSLYSRKNWVEWLLPVLQREGITEGEEVLKIKQFALFLSNIDKKDNSNETPFFDINKGVKSEDDKQIKKFVSQTDICDAVSIEKALQKINDGTPYYTSFKVDEYLNKLKDKCIIKDQIKHLNALISINTKDISYNSFEEALSYRIKEWGHSQSIKIWIKDSFAKVLNKYLIEFYHSNEEQIRSISIHDIYELAKLFEKNPTETALAFKEILKEKIALFSEDVLYQSMYILRTLITPKQATEVIDWALKKWNKKLNPDIGEGEWNETLNPSNECITFFLRYCLAHPYKNMRWPVLHVLKRLIQFGDKEILSNLIKYRNDLNNDAFQYSKYTYFTISSKLWLFIALDRISREFPEALIEHSEILYEEAIQKNNAHILIRKLAKSAALNILKHNPNIYTKEKVTNLTHVLETQFTKKTLARLRSRKGINEDHVERFSFDDLDTVGYWYDELGRLFGISGGDVAEIAEKYICDLWSFKGDAIKDNHVKVPDHEYYLTSNNHGDIPEVEDLQKYYEYHAMFYVANELLETMPTVEEKYLYRDLNKWMDKWCTTWNNHWMADLRDETPWEIDFWSSDGYRKYYTENWIYNIQSKDFDSKLLANDQKNIEDGDWLVVSANYSRYWSKDREDVNIMSSLVNVDKSSALLSALQTVSNPMRFKLPDENEESMELEDNGFYLKGWIKYIFNKNVGEDNKDNYAYDLDKLFVCLGDKFVSWAGLTFTSDYRFGFNEQNKLITKFENWSDFDDSKYPDNFASKGYRLLVKKDVLLKFLEENKCSLILECKVNRHLEKDYNSRGDEDNRYRYMPDNFKLFLIHSDGTTETINSRNN